MSAFDRLVDIVATLRGEEGCPWDRAQTPETMRPYLLEEAHEVLEAIDKGDREALRKELGDLLFQVVLLCRMMEEEGAFDIQDVAQAIAEKMVRRHPHVFDPEHDTQGDEGSIHSWEARKAKERGRKASTLDGVPKALPSLLRAHRISEKAAAVGFDWPDARGARAKLDEEVGELDHAMADQDPKAIGHELGDVLFSLVNLGRFLPVGAEDALRQATDRFERRFRALEDTLVAQGRSVHDLDAEALEPMWQQVKRKVKP